MAFGDRITNAARDVMLMAAQRRAAAQPNEQQIDPLAAYNKYPQLREYEDRRFNPDLGSPANLYNHIGNTDGSLSPGYKAWYDGGYNTMKGHLLGAPGKYYDIGVEHPYYGSDERDYVPNGYIPWTTKPLEGGDWSGTPEEAYRSYIRERDENGLIPSLRTYDNGARIPNGYEASNSYPLIEPRDRAWYDNSGYHTGKANMDWVPNKRGNYSW